MEIGPWVLVLALLGAMAFVAALGAAYDRRHRTRPAQLLGLTEAEHVRALIMSSYYTNVHGSEG